MTLDPVHFDGIVRMVEGIRPGVDERDHRDFAETVWESFLDPLTDDGVRIVEPLGEQKRRAIPVADAALQEDPFPTRHGLDSGTINPTTFRNGFVIDIAQAAMSAVPSDVSLHRGRTFVMTVHANDVTADLGSGDWRMDDEGYVKKRTVHAPRLDRFEQHVVHVLALYLAESHHALTQAESVSDLLVLDGPLYPTGLLEWKGRDARLEGLLRDDERPRDVVANYLRLVETFADRGVPLVGFVKTPASRTITRAIRRREGNAPWVGDAGLWKQLLERRGEGDRRDGGERDTDALTFTNWFVSRGGSDRILSGAGDALGLEREMDPEAYEVTFFLIYDPREDQLYRVEAPYGFTKDAELREKLAMQLLQGVALGRGPPPVVEKADELARISMEEKSALGEALEQTLESDRDRSYDETRWGLEYLDY